MQEVHVGLWCRRLAAAKLPEGGPERAASHDAVSMADVFLPRGKLDLLPTHQRRGPSLPRKPGRAR